MDIDRVFSYNSSIEHFQEDIQNLNRKYDLLEKDLMHKDKITQIKNKYREQLEDDLFWHISSLLNHSPFKTKKEDYILQNLSYSDDETE